MQHTKVEGSWFIIPMIILFLLAVLNRHPFFTKLFYLYVICTVGLVGTVLLLNAIYALKRRDGGKNGKI